MKPTRWANLLIVLASAALLGQPQFLSSSGERCGPITAADLVDGQAPAFKAYEATQSAPTPNPSLNLGSNPIARTYRTVLRDEVNKGPNFAGHYRVAIWGCGSSCAMFAVVNLKTGRVITANGIESVSGVSLAADDFQPNTNSDSLGFRYKKDSRLFVLVGVLNEDESRRGAFYFLLRGEQLVPIHVTIAKLHCKEGR